MTFEKVLICNHILEWIQDTHSQPREGHVAKQTDFICAENNVFLFLAIKSWKEKYWHCSYENRLTVSYIKKEAKIQGHTDKSHLVFTYEFILIKINK